jgi:hypothetical protein
LAKGQIVPVTLLLKTTFFQSLFFKINIDQIRSGFIDPGISTILILDKIDAFGKTGRSDGINMPFLKPSIIRVDLTWLKISVQVYLPAYCSQTL